MENYSAPAAQVPAQSPRIGVVEANRRRHPRYACEGHAEVFVPHGALLFHGRILDLSLSGCFIETPAINLERGTHVEVYFVTRQMQFRIAGHIAVLFRRRGAGIAFQDLGPRRTRQIAELIHELKEIPELKGIPEPKEIAGAQQKPEPAKLPA